VIEAQHAAVAQLAVLGASMLPATIIAPRSTEE
jgi:hypothetical protein